MKGHFNTVTNWKEFRKWKKRLCWHCQWDLSGATLTWLHMETSLLNLPYSCMWHLQLGTGTVVWSSGVWVQKLPLSGPHLCHCLGFCGPTSHRQRASGSCQYHSLFKFLDGRWFPNFLQYLCTTASQILLYCSEIKRDQFSFLSGKWISPMMILPRIPESPWWHLPTHV
jgi:hypothetical protein